MGIVQLLVLCIHRHTGGLEIVLGLYCHESRIHRHTGGLEKKRKDDGKPSLIHRHTGGLEMYTNQ